MLDRAESEVETRIDNHIHLHFLVGRPQLFSQYGLAGVAAPENWV